MYLFHLNIFNYFFLKLCLIIQSLEFLLYIQDYLHRILYCLLDILYHLFYMMLKLDYIHYFHFILIILTVVLVHLKILFFILFLVDVVLILIQLHLKMSHHYQVLKSQNYLENLYYLIILLSLLIQEFVFHLDLIIILY